MSFHQNISNLFRKKHEYEIEKGLLPDIPETTECAVIPPKVENDTNFVTIDNELVFKIQDKFSINNIYYDKETGIKTFVFNAKTREVEQYLREVK